MTDDEIRGWQISINSNPVGTDISKVEPVAYKFLDQYRELIMQYKGGYKTKEECQSIGKLLRKEYEENMQAVGRYTEFNQKYAENVKFSEALISEMNKSVYSIEDTLRIALRAISLMRGEDVSEKTILRRLGIDEKAAASTTSPQELAV